MVSIVSRRTIVCALGAAPLAVSRLALAEGKTGIGTYPVAVPGYQVMFIAQEKGYLKDEGYDFKLIQGGSGPKARAIMAAGEADFFIADILHCLQLNNRSRPTRAVNAVDLRSPSSRWVIRKDLADQGIDTVDKFVAWKRPGGAKPIFGVSSLGGTAHLWANYFMEKFGAEDKVTWVPVGNVDTMLGSLKTKQIDMLGTTVSLVADAEKNGWGKQFFDGGSEATWNKYVGGSVPVNANMCLLTTVEKDPAKVQAYANATYRAAQWIKASSPEQILGVIEPYVGSTSREANLLEIAAVKEVTDFNGIIDPEAYARGGKMWFREITGIKPVKLEDAFDPTFVRNAHAKYPG